MTFSVICISRSLAAGGEGVGQAVAARLDRRYVDEQIISLAAEQAQVDPKVVAATEQRKPLLQRIIDRLANAHDIAGVVTLASGVPVDIFAGAQPPAYSPTDDDLRVMIRAAIQEIANTGNAVIVAHAASMALAGVPGVLRVLITASPETRAERLAAAKSMSPADAATAIAASDRDRRDYFLRFYKLKEELPTHYDLVINTDVLSAEQAVDLITSAAG